MAEINDGGATSGTTTIVCTPSPSDEVAILNNLISRVSDIERFLAQLVGADVQANNLSELATDMGNLLNGSIILPNSPNSPYGPGGSIPVPDGFNGSVISGNVITTWTDGVVSFQVDNTGLVVGGGGTTNYIQVAKSGSGVNDYISFDSNEFDVGASLTWAVGNPTYVTVNDDGLYFVSASEKVTAGASGTNVQRGIQIVLTNSSDVQLSTNDGDVKRQTLSVNNVNFYSCNAVFNASATNRIKMYSILSTLDTIEAKLTVVKLT